MTDLQEPVGRSQDYLEEAEETLVDCFKRTVSTFHSRDALVSKTWRATYGELDLVTDRLAAELLRIDGDRASAVAVLMCHDTPMVAATLGILKADKITVVLNNGYPADRLRAIIASSEATVLLTDSQNATLAHEIAPAYCTVSLFNPLTLPEQPDHVAQSVTSEDIAFLTFTSGTTGRPKGVLLSHRMIRRAAIAYCDVMRFKAGDRIALLGSPSGIQGTVTIWCALSYGATLYTYSISENGLIHLPAWIEENEISVYISSASICRDLMRSIDDARIFQTVRVARLASEFITDRDVELCRKHFRSDCLFAHSLASSEAGPITLNSFMLGSSILSGHVSVGRILRAINVKIVDDNGNELPQSQIGEIALTGRYLANGYWKDANLTAERFIPDPSERGSRRFLTGDLGRFNSDGMLEVVGRKDDRVKIRGNRIELPEIVDALRNLDGVDLAAVCTDNAEQPKRILAFVVSAPNASASPQELRNGLRATLPEHMIPSQFNFLASLPLTPHGKIDYSKLRGMTSRGRVPQFLDRPKSDTEIQLADIWKSVFEADVISRSDDFFDLGGDSLIGAVISANVHAAFGVELDFRSYIDHSLLSELATLIDERSNEPAPRREIQPISPRGNSPLSLCQERIWKYSQTLRGAAGYTLAKRYLIDGTLDTEILRNCITYFVGRHDILRARFVLVGEHARQIDTPLAPVELPILDLRHESDAVERAERFSLAEARHIFNLLNPSLRFTLLRITDNQHHLVCVSHHILSDGWSWNLFLDELTVLYASAIAGKAPPLPAHADLQFSDYAHWQHEFIETQQENHDRLIEWWHDRMKTVPETIPLPFKREEASQNVDPEQGRQRRKIDREVLRQLNLVAGKNQTTPYLTRLAVLSILLRAETGVTEQIVAGYSTNRTDIHRQKMFGLFADLTTYCLSCNDLSQSFAEWLARVRDWATEGETTNLLSYDELFDALRARGIYVPEVQIILVSKTLSKTRYFGDLSISSYGVRPNVMPWGFTVCFNENSDQHIIETSFDANIYDPSAVTRFIERYARLLQAASCFPEKSLQQLLEIAEIQALPLDSPATATAALTSKIWLATNAIAVGVRRIWRWLSN